jgi:glycosyltransferase involved in cell wall biosynthesis
MRILYLCADRGIPVRGVKGASVHVRESTEAFAASGHEVLLVARRLGLPEGGEPSVPVITVPPSRRVEALPKPLRLQAYDAELESALEELIDRRRPDLLYERYALFGLAGVRAARKSVIPHFLEVNAPLVEEAASHRGLREIQEARSAEREVLAQTDRVFAVSRELARMLEVGPARVEILPNAVNPKRVRPRGRRDEARRNLGLERAFVVGFVGSLKPWHGVDVLLEAFRRLAAREPRARLLLVGDGPERKKIEHQASEVGMAGRVVLTGSVGQERVLGCLEAMDVCTAPYPTAQNFYFSPLKVFEYLAMGRPVVASRVAQITELLRSEETGLLVEPGDPGALAEALLRVARRPEAALRMGRAARRWVVEHRTWGHNVHQIVNAYEKLPAKVVRR